MRLRNAHFSYTLRPLLVSALLCANAGCLSTKYKSAKKSEIEPVALNLTALQPSIEATVHTVIIYKGAGSWKKAAYWDEYIVTINNRGQIPVLLEKAELTDFQGQTSAPGTNPWALEKESRTYEKRLLSTSGNVLKIGAGAVATGAGGLLGGLAIGSSGGYFAAAGGAIIGAAVVIPVFAGATIYRNVSSKHKIEKEFSRRRYVLPKTIQPGEKSTGSLFFRISPGPRQLALSWRVGEESHDIVVNLSPLGDLHLASPAVAKPISSAKTFNP